LRFDPNRGENYQSIGEWAVCAPVILDGRPFTFERHEYLQLPYEDNHPDQVELKAAQLGLTSKAKLRAMYQARYRNYRGILYLFPSKSDVLDFSRGRISPLIDENPDTIGKWVQTADNMALRIWNTVFISGDGFRVGRVHPRPDYLR
jgi:hypothetical protein